MSALPVIPDLLVPDFTPARMVYLDFEAFYSQDFSLTKYPAAQYIRDDRYETLGVGVKVDEEPTLWFEHAEFEQWIKTQDWSSAAVVSHNNTIEGLILAERYGVFPAFWFDTLGMSRALNLDGSLGFLAKHFGVGEKGDDLKWTKGKRRKDFTDEEFAHFGLYCINDVDLMKAVFEKMLVGFPEPELWLCHLTTLMFTQPQYVLDEVMLGEYMVEEKKRKAELLQRCGLDKKGVGSNEKLAQAFRDLGVEPPIKKSKTAKNEDGTAKDAYAFAKDDVGMHALLEHEIDEVRWLAEARIAVKSTLNQSRGERLMDLGQKGRKLPVQNNYCGTHTFRWSGAGKMNFQNLERVAKKDPTKGKLKKSLLAPAGWKVVAVDSGQIEARGVSWLAEHDAMTEMWAKNLDLYSAFATTVYAREIDRKTRAEDEVPGFVGKVCVLALGYNAGGIVLAENFLKGKSGPPLQFGLTEVETMNVDLDKFIQDERKMKRVDKMLSRLDLDAKVIHCAVADHLVTTYRKVNKPIPELWKFMKGVLHAMEQGIEGYFGPNDCLQTVKEGIVLPSGLVLRYPDLRLSKKKVDEEEDEDAWMNHGFSYFDGLKRTRTYGGAMTENVCQALARIVVTDQLLHIYATTGYRPVSGTHDEWVFIAPDSEAAPLRDFVVQTMKTTPKWAKGWPLNAEGGYAQSYGMAKA